eukprot:gene26343-17440_t
MRVLDREDMAVWFNRVGGITYKIDCRTDRFSPHALGTVSWDRVPPIVATPIRAAHFKPNFELRFRDQVPPIDQGRIEVIPEDEFEEDEFDFEKFKNPMPDGYNK